MKSSFIASLFVLLIAVVSTSAALVPESAKRAAEATADAEKWTNARRMANGLFPRRPTRLYTPTNVARHPQPSGGSGNQAYIIVKRKSPGSPVIGYVEKNFPNIIARHYATTTNPSKRMVVSYSPSDNPVNLNIVTSAPYPKLGFAGGNIGNFVYGTLTATNPTSPYSPPSAVGNSLSLLSPKSASTVWKVDSPTGKLKVQWVQTNGNVITNTKFWYFPVLQVIAVTTDSFPTGYEIELFLESI